MERVVARKGGRHLPIEIALVLPTLFLSGFLSGSSLQCPIGVQVAVRMAAVNGRERHHSGNEQGHAFPSLIDSASS